MSAGSRAPGASARPRAMPVALVALLCGAVAGCGSGGSDAEPPFPAPADAGRAPRATHFDVKLIASGLVRPTQVTAAPGDERGVWVLEQTGRLRRLQGGRRQTVLDVSDQVKVGGEQGLLGVAFHPDFARNRRLFIDYTDRNGDTRVVEYRLGRDRRAARSSAASC